MINPTSLLRSQLSATLFACRNLSTSFKRQLNAASFTDKNTSNQRVHNQKKLRGFKKEAREATEADDIVNSVINEESKFGRSGPFDAASKSAQDIPEEPPVHISPRFRKSFYVGEINSPFDYSMNRHTMEVKERQSRPRFASDIFRQTKIDPRNLYLMPEVLSKFITSSGQIMSRDMTGLSSSNQRKLAAAIKTARSLGLLSTVHKYNDYLPKRLF